MSFYSHYPYATQQRRASPAPAPTGYPYAHHPFFAAPSPAPAPRHHPLFATHHTPEYTTTSLEEEERAALAHLHAIQRRKEELEAARAREAAIRARAQAEHEAAIRAEIAREIAKQQRQQQIQQLQQQRRAEEDRRRRAYAEAIEQKRAELKALKEAQMNACLARRQRRSSPSAQPQTPHQSAGFDDVNNILGALFGINLAPESDSESDSEPEPVRHVQSTRQAPALPTCVRPAPVKAPAAVKAPAPTPAPAPKTQAPKSSSDNAPAANTNNNNTNTAFPEGINDLLSHFLGLRVEPEAAAEASTSAEGAKGNRVPEGLNEFLSQFGLVFEPEESEKKEEVKEEVKEEKKEEKKEVEEKVAPKAAPAPAPTPAAAPSPAQPTEQQQQQREVPPFTSLLGQLTDVNPVLRDLLGNFESALTEEYKARRSGESEKKGQQQQQKQCGGECQGSCERVNKGKGVAEGERNPATAPKVTPAPAPAPSSATAAPEPESEPIPDTTTSLFTLSSIESELASLQSSFTFPTRLAFAHTTPGSHPPPLLFNRVNSAYHAQTNALLQLLLQADSVSSGGDRAVRQARKELVRKVEEEIERLERKRDGMWEEVRERRERGEESEPEDEVRSWSDAGSVHEQEVEHLEHVEAEAEAEAEVEETKAEAEAPTTTPAAPTTDAEPKSYADIAKSATTPTDTTSTPAPEAQTEVEAEAEAPATTTTTPAAEPQPEPEVEEPATPSSSSNGKPAYVEDEEDALKEEIEIKEPEGKKGDEKEKEEGYELI
ncbi:hypothetical protein IAT38_002547 [Cryptococcus sp. DSM 104549]